MYNLINKTQKKFSNVFYLLPLNINHIYSNLLRNRHVKWPFESAKRFFYCSCLNKLIFERSTFDFNKHCWESEVGWREKQPCGNKLARKKRNNPRQQHFPTTIVSVMDQTAQQGNKALRFQSMRCLKTFHGCFSYTWLRKRSRRVVNRAADFSFSSMLHQTRPALAFLPSFCEGCTWKFVKFVLFTCIAVRKMIFRLVTVGVLAMVAIVLAEPTMYKKNEQNLYEPG